MPYRAMLFSLVTVLLALVAVGIWVRGIAPQVLIADDYAAGEATQPAQTRAASTEAGVGDATTVPEDSMRRAIHLHRHVQGVMLLSFILICLLLLVGFAATFREWVRFTTRKKPQRVREKTAYVDAWKLAGEKAIPPDDLEPPEVERPPDDDGDSPEPFQ